MGVETRGKFYEATGALRDMVPNHMFQLLAMIAMEAPNTFDADAVRAEKAKVIQAIRPMTAARGGGVRGARPVRRRHAEGPDTSAAYREEPDVDAGLQHGNLCRA